MSNAPQPQENRCGAIALTVLCYTLCCPCICVIGVLQKSEPQRMNLDQRALEASYLERREKCAPNPLPKTRPRVLTLGTFAAEPEELNSEIVEEGNGNRGPEKGDRDGKTRRQSTIDSIKRKARRQSTVDSTKDKPKRQSTIDSLKINPRRQSTIDSLKSKFRREAVVVDQLETSILWKLPIELRATVWRYALGGNYIHILKKRGRLGHAYCPAEHPEDFVRMDKCSYPMKDGFSVSTAFPFRTKPLGLISSCRQIYSETIDILYSHNTFSFDNLDALNWFGLTTLPHRRNLITTLHLKYELVKMHQVFQPQLPPNDNKTWRDACNVMASMTSLQELRILVNSPAGYSHYNVFPLFPAFLHGLCEISVAGSFDVYLPWPEDHPAEKQLVPENPPFQIKRLGKEAGPHRGPHRVDFNIPFTVQCLHCEDYTEIKKDTKGYAERISPDGSTEFWTFHTYCEGWIAFSLDSRGNYAVLQGAKRVPEP